MPEWEQTTLGAISDIRFSNVDKKSHSTETPIRLCNYMDVYTNEYVRADLDFMPATATTSEIAKFRLDIGDVVVTKDSESPDDIGVSAVIEQTLENLVCGYHLALIKPHRDYVDSIFLAKQLASREMASYFSRRASGSTRYGLASKVFDLAPVFLPPLDEQRKIGRVLRAIDQAIEHTEALIAKFRQMKTGLMHDLFTRGISSDGLLRPVLAEAPHLYKESNVGWIPVEWNPCPLASVLTNIDAGKSPDCPDTPARGEEWGVLKVSAISPDGLRLDENKSVLDRSHWNPRYLINKGDLLLSRANTLELVGLVCLVTAEPPKLMLSDKSLRLNLDESLLSKRLLFFAFQTDALRRQVEVCATGSSGSMKNITQNQIRSIRLPLAPIEEQERILEALDPLHCAYSSLLAEANKLRNIRSGLTNDLFTGRVRVSSGSD